MDGSLRIRNRPPFCLLKCLLFHLLRSLRYCSGHLCLTVFLRHFSLHSFLSFSDCLSCSGFFSIFCFFLFGLILNTYLCLLIKHNSNPGTQLCTGQDLEMPVMTVHDPFCYSQSEACTLYLPCLIRTIEALEHMGDIGFGWLALGWLLQALVALLLVKLCAAVYGALMIHKGERVKPKQILAMMKGGAKA